MAKPVVLLICTGNICRSPMAEYLLRRTLGPGAAWEARSAGLAAIPGWPASEPAVIALREEGVDLRPHRSRRATRELIDASALIVVMTAAHRDELKRLSPWCAEKTFLLKSFDPAGGPKDLGDPIGQPVEVYRAVRDEIEASLPGLVHFLQTLDIE